MPDADYVTVAATVHPRKFCAVLMKYSAHGDEYISTRTSTPLPREAAEALARSWAAALNLEVR